MHLGFAATGGTPYIDAVNTNTLDIKTGGVDRVRISNNGNFGIGTTDPSSRLHIVDTWNTAGTPTAIKLSITDTASNDASLLQDLQVGGTSRMSVAKKGTLAVTTNNTLATIKIQNGANTANSGYEICVGSPGNYDGYLMFRRVGTNLPGDFYLPNGSSPVFSAGVSVGDGYSFSSSSSSALAYYTLYRAAAGNSSEISFRNHSTNAGLFEFMGYFHNGANWNLLSNILVLRTNSATDARVGIGTNNPGAKLQIDAGTNTTKGLIVKAASSQNVNLTEWQNSSGTTLSSINSDGTITTDGITSDYYRTSSDMIVEESTTSRELGTSDNGKIIMCTNSSATTLTVGTTVGTAGFSVTVIQAGTGQVTFSQSSTTINNRQSHTKTAGQWAVVSLICRTTNNFVLAGDTGA